MTGHNIREDLAMACRVLARHRLIDLWGHASIRVPKSEVILVTPRFNKACLPRTIRAEDMLVTDRHGAIIEGHGELPRQFATDVALYRQSQDAGACIFASPHVAMAAAIARYKLKPLTHMESAVAFGMATWNSPGLADEAGRSAELATIVAMATAVDQPGIGVWSAGKDIILALMNMYHLEFLAQANLVAAALPTGNFCRPEDSDKMWRQFAGWDHYVEFFHSLDPGPLSHPAADCEGSPQDAVEIKRAVGLSCKALWERDTLVAFLEHISHRLPEPDRMIISAAKNFGQMGPEDMCLLDYKANWLNGPKPPGFKWFHAQILAERPDVQAIVHTHDLYGRIYALSGERPTSMFRTGLKVGMQEMPIYPRCDLMVDADIRRKALDLLDKGPIVHEACHGTDFVATTLEQALVDSIQRECFLAMDYMARRFGEPKAMATDTSAVLAGEASPQDWWWFYTAEIGAPRRSVAGL
jgi:L-fuculose-phosphate aldolase